MLNNEVRNYCHEKASKIDFNDTNQIKNFEQFMSNTINQLNQKRDIKIDDIETMVKYLVYKQINIYQKQYRVPFKINFFVLNDSVYEKEFKEEKTSRANCKVTNDRQETYVSFKRSILNEVIEKNNTINPKKFYKLLCTVFHELYHAHQTYFIFHENDIPDLDILQVKKEYIVSEVYKNYRKQNYRELMLEMDAFYEGAFQAERILKRYFEPFHQMLISKIRMDLQDYRYKYLNPRHKHPEFGYTSIRDGNKLIDSLIEDIAKHNRYSIYPLLKMEYNENRERKTYQQFQTELEYYKKRITLRHEKNICNQEEYENDIRRIEKFYTTLSDKSPDSPNHNPFAGFEDLKSNKRSK